MIPNPARTEVGLPCAGDPSRAPAASVTPPSGWSWLRGLVSLALGACLAACAHQAPSPAVAPDRPSRSAPSESAPANDGDASLQREVAALQGSAPDGSDRAAGEAQDEKPYGPQPPDGEWLVDEDGQRYFLREVPRVEGSYDWVNDEHTRVRVQYGLEFEVVEYDDESFVLKVYEAKRPEFAREREPTAASEAETRERYQRRETVAPEIADRVGLRPFSKGLPRTGQWRHGFELADMNGDGRLDLVHGPPRKGSVSRPVIFLGDGEGSWELWEAARFPAEAYDYGDVAVADFNRDGVLDLAVAMHMRGLRVLVGDGAGGFTPWSEGLRYDGGKVGDEAAFSSRALAAVDWNGDGWPDLVALGEGFRSASFRQVPGKPGDVDLASGSSSMGARLFLNRGDGTWEGADPAAGDRSLGDSIGVGDFDGDGHPDLVTASMTRGWSGLVYFGDGASGWSRRPVDALRPRAFIQAVSAAELDRDGRDEILVAFTFVEEGVWKTGVDILDLRPSGGGQEQELAWTRDSLLEIENDRFGVTALGAGDVDGDGHTDIVALTSRGEVRLFLATKGEGYVEDDDGPELRPVSEGCQGQHVAVRDIDGDGRAEVVTAFSGERTGFPGVQGKEGCEAGGSLEAWTPDSAKGHPGS